MPAAIVHRGVYVCQSWSELVKISLSYDQNKFACFPLMKTVRMNDKTALFSVWKRPSIVWRSTHQVFFESPISGQRSSYVIFTIWKAIIHCLAVAHRLGSSIVWRSRTGSILTIWLVFSWKSFKSKVQNHLRLYIRGRSEKTLKGKVQNDHQKRFSYGTIKKYPVRKKKRSARQCRLLMIFWLVSLFEKEVWSEIFDDQNSA